MLDHAASDGAPLPSDLQIFDAISALVVVLDLSGRIVFWNKSCSDLTGYSFAQAKDQLVWDLVVPEDERLGVTEAFDRVVSGNASSHYENTWLSRNEQRYWIRWSNAMAHSEPGIRDRVIATGVDITEIRDYEDKLQRSEFNRRAIIETAADAIVSVDQEQNVVLFNRGAERIFGWSQEQMLGQPLTKLLPQRFHASYRHFVIDFGESDNPSRHMDARNARVMAVRKSGEEFPAEAAISKTRGDAGDLFTIILRDISERVALETALRREIGVREEMTRTIVHDLRNPLNLIGLQLQAIYMRPDGEERRSTELMRRMQHVIADASQLLDDLLAAIRADAHQLPVVRSAMSAGELVRNAVENMQPLAQKSQLSIECQLPARELKIDADRGRMMQVLGNLIGNAVKFTPAGGKVTVGVREDGGRVQLYVRDSGPGIPEELRQHLFDPFWQGGSDDRRGAGLGLTIAKSIVDAHGGDIGLQSIPGEGTTFTVSLRKAPG